jgi:hypothetical protein
MREVEQSQRNMMESTGAASSSGGAIGAKTPEGDLYIHASGTGAASSNAGPSGSAGPYYYDLERMDKNELSMQNMSTLRNFLSHKINYLTEEQQIKINRELQKADINNLTHRQISARILQVISMIRKNAEYRTRASEPEMEPKTKAKAKSTASSSGLYRGGEIVKIT